MSVRSLWFGRRYVAPIECNKFERCQSVDVDYRKWGCSGEEGRLI